MTAFRITNVQLIDPQKQTVTAGNITIKDGLIATDDPKASTLDGQGKCLAPGIVDVGVKVCEPGERHKESFRSAGLCLLYTSPSPRDRQKSRMPSSA